jgi:hypothetical protein
MAKALVESLVRSTMKFSDLMPQEPTGERELISADLAQDLRRAFLRDDQEVMRREVERLLALGAPGVEAVMGILKSGLSTQAEAIGYAVYLQVVARAIIAGSQDFEPWTPDLLAQSVLGTLADGPFNPTAMRMAFDSLGSHLQPERIGELLSAAAGVGGTGETMFTAQLPVLDLLEAWAQEMPAGVEEVLAKEIRSGVGDIGIFARGASALAMRNTKRALELAAELRTDSRLGSEARTHGKNLERMVVGAVGRMPSLQQAAFLEETKSRPDLARAAIGYMRPEDAAYLLASAAAEGLDKSVGLALERRSGGPQAVEAGFQLYELLSEDPSSRDRLLGEMLRGVERQDARAQQLLESRYRAAEEQGQRDQFWKFLSRELVSADQSVVEDVIAPWLMLTQGESTEERRLLVAKLQARFPGRAWAQ